MLDWKNTMEFNFCLKNVATTSPYKRIKMGEGVKGRQNYSFPSRSIIPSSKQGKGFNNRKVVFISSGERPFRSLGGRFSVPVNYALVKGNPNSQYPISRLGNNEEAYRHLFDSKKQEYLNLLASTDFYNGETDELEAMTSDMMKKKKSVFLNWIQQLFLDYVDVPDVEVTILNLMRLFTYDELAPASQMIALAARDMKDDRVKDAAFSLFGHWGDERALKLLEAYDMPADPWMAIKYETLINDIKKYVICSGNRYE